MKDLVKSNLRQLLEILLLIIASVIPLLINVSELFKDYLSNEYPTPENGIVYFAISHGKWVASIIVFFALLWLIRKFNENFIMNNMRVYHKYGYWWYWICAKLLGIRKCNLILVPIYMQFKLVLKGTFDEYPLDCDDFPIIDNEPECKVTILNPESSQSEINVVLEDTYIIRNDQIPKEKRDLYTLHISRNDGKSVERHFSQKYIETVINTIRQYKYLPTVNLFATTNPKNTVHLAKRAFGLGNRGNIGHLYVYQQSAHGSRVFRFKGFKIY